MHRMIGLAVPMALGLIVVSGCDRSPSPAEQNRRAAADVAAVEAIQKIEPPIKPITLQPITPEEITAKNLGGAGCRLSTTAPAQPLALALVGRAVIKVDDNIVMLIADNGGTKLEQGAWEHYLGKQYTLTLNRAAGPDQVAGELTVRDAWDRVIYSARGLLDCSA